MVARGWHPFPQIPEIWQAQDGFPHGRDQSSATDSPPWKGMESADRILSKAFDLLEEGRSIQCTLMPLPPKLSGPFPIIRSLSRVLVPIAEALRPVVEAQVASPIVQTRPPMLLPTGEVVLPFVETLVQCSTVAKTMLYAQASEKHGKQYECLPHGDARQVSTQKLRRARHLSKGRQMRQTRRRLGGLVAHRGVHTRLGPPVACAISRDQNQRQAERTGEPHDVSERMLRHIAT